MLVDLEASVEATKARFADEKVSSRCRLLAADLTQSIPAGADVYMLKHVLHGRRDADAITILRNCRAVIPENGTLLIIEFILPPLVSQADPRLPAVESEVSVNGEHYSIQQVFAPPESFRLGMTWGSSNQSQLRRDCPLRPMHQLLSMSASSPYHSMRSI